MACHSSARRCSSSAARGHWPCGTRIIQVDHWHWQTVLSRHASESLTAPPSRPRRHLDRVGIDWKWTQSIGPAGRSCFGGPTSTRETPLTDCVTTLRLPVPLAVAVKPKPGHSESSSLSLPMQRALWIQALRSQTRYSRRPTGTVWQSSGELEA